MRTCCRCKIPKELSDFVKDKHDPTGYTYSCKVCRAKKQKEWLALNKDKVKARNDLNKEKRKEYYNAPETKLKYRKAFIERKFKISYSEYEKMQVAQNNKCAICNKEESDQDKSYLSVDHCHVTGKIRGLLCSRCNMGLGYFKDNTKSLQQAINYLNQNQI